MDEYITREESKSEKADGKGVLQTLSKQVAGPVRVRIEWHIEKFASMMDNYEPGKGIWSEGVASKREKGAVWQLRLYPNGDRRRARNKVSIYLYLMGPMTYEEESLWASYHLYLDGGFCGVKDTVVRGTKNFRPETEYNWGSSVSHGRVKEALHEDGSLVVVAEVEFPAPEIDT